jgi:hypothetical protein
MKYACAGLVESSLPSSTRPGWVRQARGVCVAVAVLVGGTGVTVRTVSCRVEVAGICVEGRVG